MVPCSETKKWKENFHNVSSQLRVPLEDYWCPPDDFHIPMTDTFETNKFGNYVLLMG
jgi:hypothetical protein